MQKRCQLWQNHPEGCMVNKTCIFERLVDGAFRISINELRVLTLEALRTDTDTSDVLKASKAFLTAAVRFDVEYHTKEAMHLYRLSYILFPDLQAINNLYTDFCKKMV